MRTSNTFSILAASALVAAAPAAASAAQTAYGTTAPVAVAACSTYAGTPVSALYNTVGFANFGSYEVSFVNHANVAAKHVGLDIDANGSVQRIDEIGKFASGTRIDKGSQLSYSGNSDGRAPACRVAEVDFVDGSSWHAVPATAQATGASAAVARH